MEFNSLSPGCLDPSSLLGDEDGRYFNEEGKEVTLELDLKTEDSRFTDTKETESKARERQIQRS